MQTDVYIKIINEKMNIKFWMAGFLVIPKVYAVIASPFSYIIAIILTVYKTRAQRNSNSNLFAKFMNRSTNYLKNLKMTQAKN